jgi:hypothetical protein
MMKKVAFLSILAMSMIAFFSCSKQGSTQIEGQVIEKGSNKPIANAKVVISQCVKGDGFGSSAICIEIDTVLTDSKGNYMYSNDEKDAINYRLSVYKDNYSMEVFQTAPAGQSSNKIDFVMRAHAWVKFHVKNITPFDENDRFALLVFNSSSDGIFMGTKIDETFVHGIFTGNFYNKINYSVKKNNLYKQISDSIFCKPLDTVFYEIKY